MPYQYQFSLILPTRGRCDIVRRLFQSILDTAERPDALEVVLYLDQDDTESCAIEFPALHLVKLIRPKTKMGAMTRACAEAASADCLLLINDDVIFRSKGWDAELLRAASRFDDGVALIWCNDLFRGSAIPNFPMLRRRICELMGGVCPADYGRDYIDTHLFDIFLKLRRMGHDRLIYLPQVVIEHLHVEAGKATFDSTYVKPAGEADELAYIAYEQERQIAAEAFARYIEGAKPLYLQATSDLSRETTAPPPLFEQHCPKAAKLRLVPTMLAMIARQFRVKLRAAKYSRPPIQKKSPLEEFLRKLRAARSFLRRIYSFDRHWVRQCWLALAYAAQENKTEIILYGQNDALKILRRFAKHLPLKVAAICPLSSSGKQRILGHPVIATQYLASSTATIILGAFINTPAHLERLLAMGIDRRRIITLQ